MFGKEKQQRQDLAEQDRKRWLGWIAEGTFFRSFHSFPYYEGAPFDIFSLALADLEERLAKLEGKKEDD